MEIPLETCHIQCPGCYQVFTDQIFVCETGHSVCEKCAKYSKCPACKKDTKEGQEGTKIRNFLLEKLLSVEADDQKMK